MKILVKQAKIVDPSSPFNGQTVPVFIENGIIRQIGNDAVSADQVIDLPGLHLSPGWTDLFAQFGDPGLEYKETIESGAAAAAAGGFTDVVVIPNTKPVVHNKAAVEYLVQKSRSLPVNVHPMGAVTREAEGRELAEMYDMRASGAIVFGDGLNPIQSSGLLVKALQYIKAFDGLLIQVPEDRSINPHGLMNEGIVSTRLGLPGKPVLAEELIVARDIELAAYAGSRLHFTGISAGVSLELIRKARAKGNTLISCSVTPAHLFFSDEDLQEYDTNLKVSPPFRTPADRKALQQAISDGTIDTIASHHLPHEYDSKVVEFEYAKPGMNSLETVYAVLRTALPGVSQEKWVELLSVNPAKLIGLPAKTIREGEPAALTLFQPDVQWTVGTASLRSRSRNTPFLGQTLTGKVAGIIHKNQVVLNQA